MTTKEDYLAFMSQLCKATGLGAFSPDDSGLVSVRVDDRYNLNLQHVETTGKVLCFVELDQLPKDAPRDIYRDLLVGGLFGKDTAGGYFAIEPETETVVYNYFFDLEALAYDVEGFVSTLENILQLCGVWELRIRSGGAQAEYGGAGHPAGEHVIAV